MATAPFNEFVLPVARAAALQAERGLPSLAALARQLSAEIEPRALPALSGFYVGAVAVGASGMLSHMGRLESFRRRLLGLSSKTL